MQSLPVDHFRRVVSQSSCIPIRMSSDQIVKLLAAMEMCLSVRLSINAPECITEAHNTNPFLLFSPVPIIIGLRLISTRTPLLRDAKSNLINNRAPINIKATSTLVQFIIYAHRCLRGELNSNYCENHPIRDYSNMKKEFQNHSYSIRVQNAPFLIRRPALTQSQQIAADLPYTRR